MVEKWRGIFPRSRARELPLDPWLKGAQVALAGTPPRTCCPAPKWGIGRIGATRSPAKVPMGRMLTRPRLAGQRG